MSQSLIGYTIVDDEYELKSGKDSMGSALGPDWCEGLNIKGNKVLIGI